MKATTKEKEAEKTAPERTGIHPEHKEQAERLLGYKVVPVVEASEAS